MFVSRLKLPYKQLCVPCSPATIWLDHDSSHRAESEANALKFIPSILQLYFTTGLGSLHCFLDCFLATPACY